MNLFCFGNNNGVPVLMFHNLCEQIPEYILLPAERSLFLKIEDFSKLISWCSKNFVILRLSELNQYLAKNDRKSRAIVLTFDDGLASTIDLALPTLKKYNASATIFVTTEWTASGQTPDIFALESIVWEKIPVKLVINVHGRIFEFKIESLDQAYEAFTNLWNFLVKIHFPPLDLKAENILIDDKPWKRKDMLDDRHFWFPAGWEELQNAAKSGLVEIGSHMVSHIPLPWISDEEKLFQLQQSRDILSSTIGCAVTACSYPHGYTDKRTIAMAGRIYNCGFTDKPGLAQLKTSSAALPRYHVPGEGPETIYTRCLGVNCGT